MNFLELAEARYSCRQFTAQPVEDDKLAKILTAANLAPTAGNMQPIKLWVVRTPENLQKVYDATPYNFGASTIIIVGGDNSAIRKTGAKDDFLSLATVSVYNRRHATHRLRFAPNRKVSRTNGIFSAKALTQLPNDFKASRDS